MVQEVMVSKMVRIERTVRKQLVHYLLTRSCMCGTNRNVYSIVTKICISLANGTSIHEFQYDPFRTYRLYDISDTIFQVSTYFYSVSTKIGVCVVYV